MNIHFVQHETFEAPGAYLNWALGRGYNVSFSKVYDGDPLPSDPAEIDLLIVMGGPQDPDTTLEQCPHFDAAAEKKLINQCIYAGKAVVGICLGSQLIGEALNATYGHSPEKEIGNFPIRLTLDGIADDKINHFGTALTVGHWHNDMPGLTSSGKILATSEGCPRQIVRYDDLVYGFQCHMELDKEVVALLIESENDLVAKSQLHRFVQTPQELLSYDYSEMNQKLYGFLDKLVGAYEKRVNNSDIITVNC